MSKTFPFAHHRSANSLIQTGFTLVELVVTMTIIAILTAIALPNYRQYLVRNAESQALAQMKQTELELESWRANTLSYKGFYPRFIENITATPRYAYADSGTNMTITVPNIVLPNSTRPNYTITLTADSAGTTSLATPSQFAVVNAWYMYAIPSETLKNYGAKTFLINSKGSACKGASSISSDCKNAGEMALEK